MARMYPRELLAADVKSKAETKVFDALRDDLDDSWEAYHSAGWTRRDELHGLQDGEVDFILCHPDRAIVCLEVKGGGLDSRHGEWYRVEKGKRERMRDPFAQALDHRYDLQRKIDELEGWNARGLLICHAVAFPDISVHRLVLAPDAPTDIVIDRNAVREIGKAVGRAVAHHRAKDDKRNPPGQPGAEMLRNLLVPTVSIRVPMAEQFLEEEEQLIKLTFQQSMLLSRFDRERRMVVTGCAGSGKTMMGVEHAKRLAERGQDVAFVCFNRALHDHLRDTEGRSGVHFFTFHGLCRHLAGRGGVELPTYPDDETPQSFWDEELPEAMVEAIGSLGGQYDALVIDEAQDLHDDWLAALMCTLRDEAAGSVWLFMDDNQRVYERGLNVPGEFRPFDLTVNCRNTQAIHREVVKLYRGEIVPQVKGPEGREIELIHSEDQVQSVARAIERLCEEEEVPPQDVVVLSSHGWAKSRVAHELSGSYRLTKERGKLGEHVYFSSIRGFKGLESPVVIVCELEDLHGQESRTEQQYVAISRARNHCVIVAPPAAG